MLESTARSDSAWEGVRAVSGPAAQKAALWVGAEAGRKRIYSEAAESMRESVPIQYETCRSTGRPGRINRPHPAKLKRVSNVALLSELNECTAIEWSSSPSARKQADRVLKLLLRDNLSTKDDEGRSGCGNKNDEVLGVGEGDGIGRIQLD